MKRLNDQWAPASMERQNPICLPATQSRAQFPDRPTLATKTHRGRSHRANRIEEACKIEACSSMESSRQLPVTRAAPSVTGESRCTCRSCLCSFSWALQMGPSTMCGLAASAGPVRPNRAYYWPRTEFRLSSPLGARLANQQLFCFPLSLYYIISLARQNL